MREFPRIGMSRPPVMKPRWLITNLTYTISTTNGQLPFRATSLHVNIAISNGCLCSLELFHMKASSVSAVLADIIFIDIFQRNHG